MSASSKRTLFERFLYHAAVLVDITFRIAPAVDISPVTVTTAAAVTPRILNSMLSGWMNNGSVEV